MVEVSVEGPHGPHPSFDTKTRIQQRKFEKKFLRALPTELRCNITSVEARSRKNYGCSGETRTHDLVLIMQCIPFGAFADGQGTRIRTGTSTLRR